MKHTVQRAMHQPDDLVIEFDYRDAKGTTTHRVVSPIRFLDPGRLADPGHKETRGERSAWCSERSLCELRPPLTVYDVHKKPWQSPSAAGP
ncbi:MAG: hypothetical protein R6U98_06695 [Pirellulaceae bacterium]